VRRALLLAIAVVASAVLAAMPFHTTVGDGHFRVPCRAAVVGAWNTEPKGRISVAESDGRYQYVAGAEPHCAPPARLRLVGSVLLALAGAVVATRGGAAARASATRP
jgi:hypothetical protein